MNFPTNLETMTLNEQPNYRLMEKGKIKNYFDQEVKDQQILVKKLNKYITGFDYTDDFFLTVFS